ncbi:GGDEF domain-containing protein [Celerinatantimonas yamalensis]|uniref:diguanylate cyclase n=1 Tax=Celerinatantimonas yamalensis TaxID=559956 RepID=A0ABW9G2X6_9GAMM
MDRPFSLPPRLRHYLLGSDNLPLFYQVHHTLLLLTCVFLAISATFNFAYLDIPFIYNWILLANSLMQIVLWYFSRYKQQFKRMAIIYVFNILFVSLPLNWFMDAGSYGPTLAFTYIAVIYCTVVLYEINYFRLPIVFMMVAQPLVLIQIEHIHPSWILTYTQPEQRYEDIMICNLISLMLMIAMMGVYSRKLNHEINRANQYARRLKQISETDSLTQLKNRSFILDIFRKIFTTSYHLHVLVVDIDHFKHINDSYGHSSGDQVLVQVAACMQKYCHQHGALLSRYGGEEFIIIAFFQTFAQTVDLADHLRRQVATLSFSHCENVTISIGVAQREKHDSHHQLIKRADQALYQAKRHGRNRVCVTPAS